MRTILGIVACVAAAVVLVILVGDRLALALDRLRFPWAYPGPGHPGLVGAWVGSLTTPSGRPRVVYLTLALPPRAPDEDVRCNQCEQLAGRARMCDEERGERRSTVGGRSETFRATRFSLGIVPADAVPPDGLTLTSLVGRWNGADSVQAEVRFYAQRGAASVSSTDDPDTERPVSLPMGRGSAAEFARRCAAIAK